MRGIWDRFRAALCISGGNRPLPPTLSAPDLVAGGGGEGQEDLLSALPDDALLLVLLHLPSAAAAARTSVLSRRWRRLWAHLPELRFPHPADLARTRAATALSLLHVVVAGDADPGDASAVLLLAAPRLTGQLIFHDLVPNNAVPQPVWNGGDVELPCFDKAERIDLRLGYLDLALPLSGVFAKLTVLRLYRVRFHGPCDLGDGLSSARCPSLRELRVFDVLGVSNLTIRSESLINMDLGYVEGLQQLTIVAPMLRELCVRRCFSVIGRRRQPVADISAPVLEMLRWADAYDMSSVQLGELAQLRELRTFCILSYGDPDYPYNWDPVMLLQRFQKIPILDLLIIYPILKIVAMLHLRYTLLPDIEEPHLRFPLSASGHAFEPCVFQLLSNFSGIRKLKLKICEETKAETIYSPGCVCHQPQNWETEELYLNSLQEVEICRLRGSERELAFLKRLLKWTAAFKTITLVLDPSVTASSQICQELLGHSRPEIRMKIYLYRNGSKVMYRPVG